jgi:hypothetical protein
LTGKYISVNELKHIEKERKMGNEAKSGNEGKVPATRMPERRYAYFRDDQVTFLVAHRTNEISEAQLRKFLEAIKPHLKGGEIMWPPRVVSFPAVSADQYKQWQARVERINSRRTERGETPLPQQVPSLDAISMLICKVNNGPDDPFELIDIIRTLSHQLKDSVEGLTVRSVAPNWLISGTSQGGATGGPGGLPKPFKTEQNDPMRVPYRFQALVERLQNDGLYSEGENVDVAILDTAPCGHELVAAYKQWNTSPMIDKLLGPEGKLHLYPATYDELLRMGNTSLNRHDYPMPDHGLFAAGIIHSIVPKATIHLIEVLNPLGVGDLEALTGGLRRVLEEIYKPGSGRRLVVNCSWMLELPLVDSHCYATLDGGPDYEFEQAVYEMIRDDPNPVETKEQAFWLKELCDRLSFLGWQVVAAAGNDWNNAVERSSAQGQPRAGNNNGQTEEPRQTAPHARYPAALTEVIGVGALPPDSKIPETGKHRVSNFSNLGDKPAGIGIMTFGGEEGTDNNGKDKGVLGLYLGDKFPERVPNSPDPDEITLVARKNNEQNPWAWWSGTSFATPVLTGAIAAVLGTLPESTSSTQDAIEDLYEKDMIAKDGTDMLEDVLETVQVY